MMRGVGVVVASIVITLWAGTLAFGLERGAGGFSIATLIPFVLLRTFLTTGLFITAHDAIHGSCSRTRGVNVAVGRVAAFLFAALSFSRLAESHRRHHASPASEADPDFHAGGYAGWSARFFARYVTWYQLGTMAALYHLMHLRWDGATLWLVWAGPALLASVQLFTFGTYLPHRAPTAAMGEHRARSQARGHAWAMLTCWFFGYHREHHEAPHLPWWRLWQTKRASEARAFRNEAARSS